MTSNQINILPKDGTVLYFPNAIQTNITSAYFDKLLTSLAWEHDEVIVFGKKHITSRKIAWHGDSDFAYTYSGSTKIAAPWTGELYNLKKIAEELSGSSFNSCLANLYHNGSEGMGYHSDDEKTLGRNPVIASFSLGASRKFSFKHRKSKESISLVLENGSMLLMKDETQHFWLHSLPKSKRVLLPRINLTFRSFTKT